MKKDPQKTMYWSQRITEDDTFEVEHAGRETRTVQTSEGERSAIDCVVRARRR